jgi:hypothetical protein
MKSSKGLLLLPQTADVEEEREREEYRKNIAK